MDDFYSIAVNSDPKHGLGLSSSSDLETFHFPTLCEDLDQEQLLALDDPQSFYLTFPDTGVFGACDEALSRASSAVTPQSDCSTRTTTSARNLSPTSDILTFQDQPTAQDIEAMYHDTTQSIIANRQSRAASATWPSANTSQSGMSNILTPPMRTISHRPQSFSYRTPQISQKATTPPPPSTFFPSPSMQQQTATSRSPFVSPNLGNLGSQIPQLQPQNAYMRAGMMANPSYYTQSQSQPFQQSSNPSFQQQLQQHFQQQNLSLQQPITHRRSIQGPPPTQSQMAAPLFNRPQLTSQSSMPNTATTTINSATAAPTLPNTTGNSSTGYQCFSHGCGGRHFSNWGNLVRHHRERQLRSKAGAKPTCPRCGKGFTRSSARDAHVAGLKCVLGRRRRGGAGTGNQMSTSVPEISVGSGDAAADGESSSADGVKTELAADGDTSIDGPRNGDLQVKGRDRNRELITEFDADHEHDQYQDNGSDSSREDMELGDADEEDDDDSNEAELLGSRSLASHSRSQPIPPMAAATAAAATVTAAQLAAQVAATDALAFGLGLSTSGDPGRTYLAPQQLQFGH